MGKKKKGNQSPSQKGRGGAPMVPPGVPPYSKEDDAIRNSWKKGSKIEIYSEGQRRWEKGEIVKVFRDNEGEWLLIKYAGFRTKEIQRFSNYIRAIQKNKKQNKSENKKPAKKKEPKKVTTQSKYRKKEKVGQAQSLEENEILIKGNSQHIKKYIDRACMLLRGSDAGHPRPSKDDEKTATPSKKYDVIHLIGSGRAMGPVVSTAEIVKRIIGGLYQQTLLHS